MIKSRLDLKYYLAEDAKRNGISQGNIFVYFMYRLKVFVGNESACAYRYIKCLRYYEFHLNNSGIGHRIISYFYKFKLSRLGLKYNIQISPNTCGYGLRLMHLSGGGGILLNVEKVGNYCGFNSGVLLGNVDSNENRPIMGNHVGFGPGAKAFGKIVIGDNVFVAANAVVVKNIPDNCIVGGVPAKIIKMTELKKT